MSQPKIGVGRKFHAETLEKELSAASFFLDERHLTCI